MAVAEHLRLVADSRANDCRLRASEAVTEDETWHMQHAQESRRRLGAGKSACVTCAAVEDVYVACAGTKHDEVLIDLVEAGAGDRGIAPAHAWQLIGKITHRGMCHRIAACRMGDHEDIC